MNEINRRGHSKFSARFWLVLLAAAMAALAAACAATPTAESTGGYIDDSTITTKIKADLTADSKVSALDIHVRTYKGVVELSGFVNSQADVAEAGRVASQVSGVTSVHNNLIVKGAVAPARPPSSAQGIE